MFHKGFTKILIVSLLIFCILFLAADPGLAGEVTAAPEGAVLYDALAETRGNEWFVTETGTGTDCSRANPGPLEYCVEKKAQSGDTVYVGEGFYRSKKNPLADNLLMIEKSLHLVGSCTWRATGPVTCYPQNEPPATGTSYLDGHNQQRVIAIVGSNDISVSIEGFQIQQGAADHKEPKPGGAILGAGGGIFAGGLDELVLKNNYFWSNHASKTGTSAVNYGYGGGVFAWFIRKTTIEENRFVYNSASSPESSGLGGGMYISASGDGGHVAIRSNIFNENMVGKPTPTTYSRGAGVFIDPVRNLNLDNNIFKNHNHSVRQDWIDGSALVLNSDVEANSIDHNVFQLNYGRTIVEINGLTGPFTRNTFWDNSADYVLDIKDENDIKIMNNFFGTTQAPFLGLIDIGIGEDSETPVVDIINNTFTMATWGIRVDEFADVHILRNIFTSFLTAITVHHDNTYVYVNENLFWNNVDNGDTGTTYWEEDPKLVDLLSGDLHLKKDSAAIDKVPLGTVSSDIDYQPRPIGTMVDLGADEYGTTFFMPLIKR